MSVRLGVNPLLWTNDDVPELGDETPLTQCLAEAARAGFAGIELGRKFPRTHTELAPLLADAGLALVSGWYSSRLLTRDAEAELAALEPHLALLEACGAQTLVFCDVSRCVHSERATPVARRPRLTDADWQRLGQRLDRVADAVSARGFTLAYHPHMGTAVQSDADIDRLLRTTGERVRLLLDTGHCAFAGGDALALIARWGPRVAHVHCKDVRRAVLADAHNRDASFIEAVLDGAFTIAGDGDLDFPAVFAALAEAGYRGWLVSEAEQDPAVAPSWPLAERSGDYLRAQALAAGWTIDGVDDRGVPHEPER